MVGISPRLLSRITGSMYHFRFAAVTCSPCTRRIRTACVQLHCTCALHLPVPVQCTVIEYVFALAIRHVDPGRHDFGLNLKFSGKAKQVLGYTRRRPGRTADGGPGAERAGGGTWEFTDRAVRLIEDYKVSVSQFLPVDAVVTERVLF